MAVRIKGLKKALNDVRKKIKDVATNKGLLKGIGQASTKEIKKTIREGVSPKTEKRFIKLKPKTISRRKTFAKKGGKSPFFIASKSNLTMTGKMVRSLKSTVEKNQIIIKFHGNHHDDVTNQQLAEWHDEGAGRLPVRSMFGITKESQKKIVKAINIFLKRKLK